MPAEKPRFRDIIGAPNPLRYRQIWHTGLKDALMYFDPDSFSVMERENSMKSAPKQTQCGQCYFWAMKQPACMAFRICLFWSILCLQLMAMPTCLISWCSLCPPNSDSNEGLGKKGGGIGGGGPACCCPSEDRTETRSPV